MSGPRCAAKRKYAASTARSGWRLKRSRSCGIVDELHEVGVDLLASVDVITAGRPVGAAVPPPVRQDAAVPALEEARDLVLPHAGVEHPAGDKHDRRSAAVVLIGQAGAVARLKVRHLDLLI